jgi:putative ABC transport system permease protein
MRWLTMLRLRLRALLRPDAADSDLDIEMQDHLQHLVEEHVARGMTIEQARRAARREFGPFTQLVEEARDARGVSWAANALQDMQYGARLMSRAPAFSIAALLTVALGVGATTAMFSVVYGVLLHPLPYGDADRLVNLWSTAPSRGLPRAYVGMANVYDWKARNHVFDDIASARPIANFNLVGQNGEPERLLGARISSNFLPLLRVSPMLGRTFTADDDKIGHEHVALLSYGLWRRRFGADRSIVGREISLSGMSYTVVGVMGPDFAFPSRDYQIWAPHTFDPAELVTRASYSYIAVARLKAGVTLAQANADLAAIMLPLEREFPKSNAGVGAVAVPVLADTIAAVKTPLYILLAAVVAILLIGCANLANLLMARALARQRELAVRVALGATRARLVTQSIVELVPLLAAGGALGIVIAAWAIDAMIPLLPPDLPRAENIALNEPVLALAFGTIAALTVFVGAWPARQAARTDLLIANADQSRGVSAGVRRTRTRDLLVVSQIAATLWLAIGATLLTRSFAELKRVNPGFNAEGVYSVHLAIPRTKYRTDAAIAALIRQILERIEALPGVVAAGMVNRLPLAGGAQTAGIEFEGIDASIVSPLGLQSDIRPVTPDYFRALGVPLVSGRTFTESDGEDAPPIGIIDDRAAKLVFRSENPIGRRFRPVVPGAPRPWQTIVGVVGHVRHDGLDEDGRPQVYWSYRQNTQDREALVVRTAGDPASLAQSIAAAIRSVDPDQPIYDARTLEAVVDRSLAQRWLQTTLLAGFAAVALLLASIGVYGVIAYGVGQRRREFGIRLALGATRPEIVGLVLRRGGGLFVAGATVGLVASAATARVLRTLLFHVAPFDPISIIGATLVMLAVAIVAAGLPARRAAAVDPSVTLRSE